MTPTIIALPLVFYLVQAKMVDVTVRASVRRIQFTITGRDAVRLIDGARLQSLTLESFSGIALTALSVRGTTDSVGRTNHVAKQATEIIIKVLSPTRLPTLTLVVPKQSSLLPSALLAKPGSGIVVERSQPDGDCVLTVDEPEPRFQFTASGVVRLAATNVFVAYSSSPATAMDTVDLQVQIDPQHPFITVETGRHPLTIIATSLDQQQAVSIKSPADVSVSNVRFLEQDESNGRTISSIRSGVLSFPGVTPGRDVTFNDRDLVDFVKPQMLRLRDLAFSGAVRDISVRVDGQARGVAVGSPSIAKTYTVTRIEALSQPRLASAFAILAWLTATSFALHKFLSESIGKDKDKT